MILCVAAESDYLPGLATLDYSLRRNGNVPRDVERVLISDSIAAYDGWRIVKPRVADYAGIPNDNNRRKPRFSRARWKLDALLLPSDITVVLDADTLCLGDISALWEPTHPIMAAYDHGIGPSSRMNTGVVVLSGPGREAMREELIDILRRGESADGSDQGAYHRYIDDHPELWGVLDTRYNTLKRLYVAEWAKELWNEIHDDIRLLHYVGMKPWQGSEAGYEGIDTIWHAYHERSI